MSNTDLSNTEIKMELYAIYDHPADYPDSYIMRRFLVLKGVGTSVLDEKFLFQSPILETCRELMVTMGKTKIPLTDPDPKILESYW